MMGLVGSLWNRDLRTRLQRIHQQIARQASSGEQLARRSPVRSQRRRPGLIRDAIIAVLAEHDGSLRVRDIAAALAARLGEPVSVSTVKSCLWRDAQSDLGRFERSGRGRYRLRLRSS